MALVGIVVKEMARIMEVAQHLPAESEIIVEGALSMSSFKNHNLVKTEQTKIE